MIKILVGWPKIKKNNPPLISARMDKHLVRFFKCQDHNSFLLTKIETEHSLNLPRAHLEQQYEQKRKKCRRPHLQQTGLDWMSILAPNQEIEQHKIFTTPGKTRKDVLHKADINLF